MGIIPVDEGETVPLTGYCPCGCCSTPWFDDADCVRHRPLGRPVDWSKGAIGTFGDDGPRITALRHEARAA